MVVTINGIIKEQKIAAEVQHLGMIIVSLQYVQIIVRYMMVLDLIEEHLISYGSGDISCRRKYS